VTSQDRSDDPFRFQWERRIRGAGIGKRGNGGMSVLAVAFYLSTWANGDGTNVFPGTERIAKDCGCNVATVYRALEILRNAGWIERVRQGNKRNKQADVYHLSMPEQALGGTTAIQSPPDHLAIATDHLATTSDHLATRGASGCSTATPPVHRSIQGSFNNQYRQTAPVEDESNDPWAGLEVPRPVPPQAAADGEGQRQEPPLAATREDPWAGLDDLHPSAPMATGTGEAPSSDDDEPVRGLNGELPPSFDDESEPPTAATCDSDANEPEPFAAATPSADALGHWGKKEHERRLRIASREAGEARNTYIPSWSQR
jgi:hypothetical protein